MKELAKIIRDEAGQRMAEHEISAVDIVDWLYANHSTIIDQYMEDGGFRRRAMMSLVEKLLREGANKESVAPQMEMAPILKETLEQCPGLPRCVSYLKADGTALYVAWFRASDDQLHLAEEFCGEQSDALKGKEKAIRELRNRRDLIGVPKELGLVQWKELGGEAAA